MPQVTTEKPMTVKKVVARHGSSEVKSVGSGKRRLVNKK
jgi:hypothetical protein